MVRLKIEQTRVELGVFAESPEAHKGVGVVNLKSTLGEITLFDPIDVDPSALFHPVVFLVVRVIHITVPNELRTEQEH